MNLPSPIKKVRMKTPARRKRGGGGIIHSKVVHPISISEEEDEGSKESPKKPTSPTNRDLGQEVSGKQPEGKRSIFTKKRAQIVKVRQTGDSIDEDLAVILSDRFWVENVMSKDLFVEKVQKSLRPDNVVSLQVPAIQDFIWKELPENIRGRDK